jgi:FKBP-type peptidyl-prolyl cis-trans isomerase SlyD
LAASSLRGAAVLGMIADPNNEPVTAMTSEPMTIGDKSVVSFHYKLSDDSGTFNESSDAGNPVVYLHGANNIVPGLEKELLGKKSGDKLTATVTPEEGYGQRNESAVQRVPIKHLASRGPFSVGQTVVVNTREGGRQARVVKVGHFNVDLDLNHPLAGRTLTFDIEILEVRAATEEELTHGHAHGPHGHGHDHDH